MEKVKKKGQGYQIDMIHGPLAGKLLVFAIPLMLSSILQLLFNAADVIVVGQFVGPQALAAVDGQAPGTWELSPCDTLEETLALAREKGAREVLMLEDGTERREAL